MKIAIGSDHAGFKLKQAIKRHLIKQGHEVIDHGTDSEKPADYPDYAVKVASSVSKGKAERGILICGTGIGMAVIANKFRGVRAAVINSQRLAKLSREHNDTNIIALSGRDQSPSKAERIVEVWLATPGPTEKRHLDRLKKIAKVESKGMR